MKKIPKYRIFVAAAVIMLAWVIGFHIYRDLPLPLAELPPPIAELPLPPIIAEGVAWEDNEGRTVEIIINERYEREVFGRTVDMQGTVRSSHPHPAGPTLFTDVVFALNGERVKRIKPIRSIAMGTGYAMEYTFNLQYGENELVITALYESEIVAQRVLTIMSDMR